MRAEGQTRRKKPTIFLVDDEEIEGRHKARAEKSSAI